MARMSYVQPHRAEGHDPDCAAHYMEPCDCIQGIVRTVKLAFAAQLATLASRPAESDLSRLPLGSSGRTQDSPTTMDEQAPDAGEDQDSYGARCGSTASLKSENKEGH
jgi:hypothetical protein